VAKAGPVSSIPIRMFETTNSTILIVITSDGSMKVDNAKAIAPTRPIHNTCHIMVSLAI